jgi:hypothetical protein
MAMRKGACPDGSRNGRCMNRPVMESDTIAKNISQ